MGEVYRAKDTKLNRDVAIKVLPESVADNPDRMARFEREAQVLASLNHQNIAAIYGLEESANGRALVMELVEGPTLADRIGGRAMSLDDALPIAQQIADALEYAHERGIIHRDLKPANIKLTGDGKVKVLDFGLAKAMEPPTPATAVNPSISPTLTIEGTRAGVILGTASYMAPEQARGAAVDKRADIWAFGVVLYEMLTGKQPFEGAAVSDTLAAVLKTEPDFSQVPNQALKLLRHCLEKDPKRRLRDIGEALFLLEDTAPEASPMSGSSPTWKLAAAAMALLSLVAIALLLRETRTHGQSLVRLNVLLSEFAVAPGEGSPGASVVLSPDGRRIVYTGRGTDGTFRLYTRTLDQEMTTPLAGTEDAYGPFFSPDGLSIGFFARGKLKTISVERGGVVELCSVLEGSGGSWSEDGTIIGNLSGPFLSRIPASGGEIQTLTELKPEGNEYEHAWPQLLPGGQAVLFTSFPSSVPNDESTIEVLSLRTGQRQTIMRGGYYGRYVPSGHLIYMRHGTLYAVPMDLKRLLVTGPAIPVIQEVAGSSTKGFGQVAFSSNGMLVYVQGKAARYRLAWLDASGETKPLRATPAEYYGVIRFSPDGKRLAMGMVQGGATNVWAYTLERETMTRLTFTPGFDLLPVWSPDGQHIAFQSARRTGSQGDLYWTRTDGASEDVPLSQTKNPLSPSSFSPDGKWLAFEELNPKTHVDIWMLPVDHAESDRPKVGKPQPFLVTAFNEESPMFSPDGRWLAYQSDESGQAEVYVRPFPGPGEKLQVSAGGGKRPIWSRKASELFYRGSEGMMVASYRVTGASFSASRPRLWSTTRDLGEFFDLAPDGKRFALIQTETSDDKRPTHVIVLLNFFDELRRRVPTK
jgi:serine/threonine-protein kinase